MRQFDVAATKAMKDTKEDEVDWIEFDIVERDPEGEIVRTVPCRAQEPSEGHAIYLMAAMGRTSSNSDKVASIIDLFYDTCDDPTKEYIQGRLLDRQDEFGFTEVVQILEGLMEEWGGFPTKQPSDYQPSQKNGGRRSTRRTPQPT